MQNKRVKTATSGTHAYQSVEKSHLASPTSHRGSLGNSISFNSQGLQMLQSKLYLNTTEDQIQTIKNRISMMHRQETQLQKSYRKQEMQAIQTLEVRCKLEEQLLDDKKHQELVERQQALQRKNIQLKRQEAIKRRSAMLQNFKQGKIQSAQEVKFELEQKAKLAQQLLQDEVGKVKQKSANRHEVRDKIKEDQDRQRNQVHEQYVQKIQETQQKAQHNLQKLQELQEKEQEMIERLKATQIDWECKWLDRVARNSKFKNASLTFVQPRSVKQIIETSSKAIAHQHLNHVMKVDGDDMIVEDDDYQVKSAINNNSSTAVDYPVKIDSDNEKKSQNKQETAKKRPQHRSAVVQGQDSSGGDEDYQQLHSSGSDQKADNYDQDSEQYENDF